MSAAEFRDKATSAHIRRIGKLSTLVADLILLKPGPLDAEERRVMEQHTVFGAKILEESEAAALQLAGEIALSHHERWDGNGYPRGLAREEIPLEARIVAVVDYFDAIVYHRPYRAAMDVEDALAPMRSEREAHFDPVVLDIFFSLQPQVVAIRARIDAAALAPSLMSARRLPA